LEAHSLWAVLSPLVYLVVLSRMETIGLSSVSGQASTCSAIEPCPMTSADQPLCSRLYSVVSAVLFALSIKIGEKVTMEGEQKCAVEMPVYITIGAGVI
jgi:hypothetical protein